jgi:hypothetical protein
VDLIDARHPEQFAPSSLVMRATSRIRVVLLTVALGAVVGCSDSPYPLAPAHGTVTLDGQPLTGSRVMFAPINRGSGPEAGKAAFGSVASDGNYALSTYSDGDGAIVGDHVVTIYVPKQKNGANVTPGNNDKRASSPKFMRIALPEKKTVAAGQDNQIDIRLTSQDVARFALQDD